MMVVEMLLNSRSNKWHAFKSVLLTLLFIWRNGKRFNFYLALNK